MRNMISNPSSLSWATISLIISAVLFAVAELIGSNDHLLSELPLVIEYARRGILDASSAVSRRIPLQAAAINQVLDELGGALPPIPGIAHVRTVIVP